MAVKDMKPKYILLFVTSGITKQVEYPVSMKEQAIADYRNVRMRVDRAKLFSIDSDDSDIWYDLSNKY